MSIVCNLLAAGCGLIAAILWFMSAWPNKMPDKGGQFEVMRGGTNTERERVALLNRSAAIFTALCALFTGLAVLYSAVVQISLK